jgi:selenium metabolism protein YedF
MSVVIVINSDIMGGPDRELGLTLIKAFFMKVWARAEKPNAICFYNSGVNLLVKGSFVLSALDALETQGVDLVACGTCLKYYEIDGELAVGRQSNMEEILDLMMNAQKVITI